MTKSRRIKWRDKARTDHIRNVYHFFLGKHNEKKELVTPRRRSRRVYNIKTDHKGKTCKVVQWFQLSQYRDRQRVLVSRSSGAISWAAEWLSASQESLCSTEFNCLSHLITLTYVSSTTATTFRSGKQHDARTDTKCIHHAQYARKTGTVYAIKHPLS
jgi:hypothetical protein